MLGVLSSCMLLGALELGKWAHEYVSNRGFDAYVKWQGHPLLQKKHGFDSHRMRDSLKKNEHEWDKHATCSESVLDQHGYFATALDLKDQLNLLKVLKTAGIEPDDGLYSLSSVKEAIRAGTGYAPGIECNVDESGNSQLYQIYMCVDSSATSLIECPLFPRSRCSQQPMKGRLLFGQPHFPNEPMGIWSGIRPDWNDQNMRQSPNLAREDPTSAQPD
ncbi:Ribonuclease 1 [Acorus calamus]|uniref:Ribonuclease 1 n=1 Tax=Acorus calamus TaxID=4465 RepID=A0AAV9EJZ6_ACOCL|nr:Ribonuclease 1 [Acorus calamus]